MEPSREWCAQPAVSCAGTSFDARLPLEDELTNDSNGVESSWRHYLDLAKQAATEADALGNEYIQHAVEWEQHEESRDLQQDQRAQVARDRAVQAIEELQNICGTTLDPVLLLKLFKNGSADGDLDFLHDSSLSCATDNDCAANGSNPMMCMLGKCIFDPASVDSQISSDLARLKQCLNPPTASTYMHLAEDQVTQLCVWQMEGDRRRICEQSPAAGTPKYKCPIKSKNCSAFDSERPAGSSAWIPVKDGLGLISSADVPDDRPRGSGASAASAPSVCDVVRKLRTSPDLPKADEDVMLTTIANATELQELSARTIVSHLGFEARLDTHGAITYNGVPRYSTGDTWTGGLMGGWPCRGAQMWTSRTSEALFENWVNCLQTNERASIVDRMARAVMAAAATFGAGSTPGDFDWSGIDWSSPRGGLHGVGAPKQLGEFIWPMLRPPTRLGAPTVRNMGGTYAVNEYGSATDGAKSGLKLYDDPAPSDRIPYIYRPRVGQEFEAPSFHDIAVKRPPAGQPGPWRVSFESNFPADLSASITGGRGPAFWWGGIGNNTQAGYFLRALRGDEQASALLAADPVDRGTPANHTGYYGEMHFRYERQAMLDGFELVCELSKLGAQQQVGCDAPPKVQSVEDLSKASGYLECLGDRLKSVAVRTVLFNFPEAAIDPLRESSSVGSFPSIGGEEAVDISALRNGLVELAKVPDLMAGEMRTVASQVEAVHLAVRKVLISNEITDVQLESNMLNQMASCSSALANLGSVQTVYSPGSVVSASVTCTNAFAQMSLSKTINDLSKQLMRVDADLAINQFAQQFSSSVTNMTSYSKRLVQAIEDVDANLAKIELQQSRAKRALLRALYVNSFESRAQVELSAGLWKRYLGTRQRYQNAYGVAQKMAFLAKRAIELRLGIHLNELTSDLPLVAAPSTWESKVCTTSGLDWTKLSQSGGTNKSDDPTITQYADAFIGDYVNKLANVVESYRLAYNFHEGSDTTVLSLRDDIQSVRADCDVESTNLLYHTAHLEYAPTASTPGWTRLGCQDDGPADGGVTVSPVDAGAPRVVVEAGLANADGGTSDARAPLPPASDAGDNGPIELVASASMLPTCIQVLEETTEGGAAPLPLTQDHGELTQARVYHLKWTAPSTATRLVQDVPVEGGRYRASLYVRLDQGYAEAPLHLTVADPSAPTQKLVYRGIVGLPAVAGQVWGRYYEIVDVPVATTVRFEIVPPRVGSAIQSDVVVAAPMLEKIETAIELPAADAGSNVDTSTLEPRAYEGTTDVRTHRIATCEDTDGEVFRAKAWRRGSALLCSDGFSGHCHGSTATKYNYWETTFDLHQSEIEAGRMIGHAGFARGNFNYRMDSLAVNFVGTDVRNCSDSNSPSSCYASGSVPYTLVHNGPYYVRNHMGRDFQAQLFTGRIENARGLASERYITNPLSSADRELLKDYTRLELQGRPLDGNFVLRVWDTPGVDFHAIKDVQVVLNYKYWTRFQ